MKSQNKPSAKQPRSWALFGLQIAIALAVSAGIRGLVHLYEGSQVTAHVDHPELLPPAWRPFANTPPQNASTASVGDSVMTYLFGAVVVLWLAAYLYAWSWGNFLLTQALRNFAAWQLGAALCMSINPVSSIWFWLGVMFQVCAILSLLEYFGWLLLLLKLVDCLLKH